MKALLMAIVASTTAGMPGNAGATNTEVKTLVLRPKAAIIQAEVPSHSNAPFVNPVSEADLELLPKRDERQEASRSSCVNTTTLCYDPNSGRIVYKPARALMPEIPGLRRENISVKRDRIVFRYSF